MNIINENSRVNIDSNDSQNYLCVCNVCKETIGIYYTIYLQTGLFLQKKTRKLKEVEDVESGEDDEEVAEKPKMKMGFGMLGDMDDNDSAAEVCHCNVSIW